MNKNAGTTCMRVKLSNNSHKGWHVFSCVLLCIACLCRVTSADEDCKPKSQCSCEYGDGGVVDLTPLGRSDGQPAFLDIPVTVGGDEFSWNPCYPFSEGTPDVQDCSQVAVCQKQPGFPSNYFNLGTQDSVAFITDDSGLTISYSAVDVFGTRRTSFILLTCEDSTTRNLLITGEKDATAQYYMELRSKYSCKIGGSGGLTPGSVLCIIYIYNWKRFFTVLAVYLIGGVLFNIFYKKESGVKAIPNVNFWTSLPGYIKDGFCFVIRRGKTSSYDTVK